MKLQKDDTLALMTFLAAAGRGQESAEAWAHALFDLQESVERIFEKLIPEALKEGSSVRSKQEILWDLREEFRHIEYHMGDAQDH